MDEMENDIIAQPSYEQKRYCSIASCVNARGILDPNIVFFRAPAKGTLLRDRWIMELSSSKGVDLSFECFDRICQLHFNPEDVQMEMHNDKPMYKLKNDAVPLPIENPTAEVSDQMEYMQDVKFIDMNRFLDISCDTAEKSDIILANESHAAPVKAPPESKLCVKCSQYGIQLQKANMKVRMLENQLKTLKMKILCLQQPTKSVHKKVVNVRKRVVEANKSIENAISGKCQLCCKRLSLTEMDHHLCLEQREYLKCTYCLMTFNATKSFLNHIGVHQAALKIDRKYKFFKCQKCPVVYVMKVLLDCHKMSHIMGYDTVDGFPIDNNSDSLITIKLEELDKSENFENINEPIVLISESAPLKPSTSSSNLCAFMPDPDPEPATAPSNSNIDLKNVFLKLFKCGKCDESFETGPLLQRHLRVHKFPTPVPAPVPIPVAAPAAKQIRKKQKSSKSAKQQVSREKISIAVEYECYLCKRKYKNLKFMRKHMRNHMNDGSITSHLCPICRTEQDRTNMNTHLCSGKNDVQCEYCSKGFKSTNKLLKHLDKVHRTNRRFYRCDKCPMLFPMIWLKDCHQNTHADEPDQHLKTDTLNKTLPNAEAPKPHMCEKCGKTFTYKHTLWLHKRSSSHADPTIECPDCDKKFYTTAHLRRHSSVHDKCTNGNKYVCEYCEKQFHSADSLRTHKKRHNRTEADRRFACKLCPMKFFDPKYLHRHKIKHLGIKQYHCRYCDQSYKYRGDFHKHLRTHFIDGKIYECSKCQMRFKYYVELQNHSFEHYKEEKVKNMNQEEESAGPVALNG